MTFHLLFWQLVESIPAKTFHKHVRPGWTPELSNAHKLSNSAWLKGRNAGKPSSSTDPIKVAYKDAKRHFRRLLKQLHNVQFYDELTQHRKDSGKFLDLLRAHAGSQPVLTNSLLVDGCEFTADTIHQGWAGYFEDVGL